MRAHEPTVDRTHHNRPAYDPRVRRQASPYAWCAIRQASPSWADRTTTRRHPFRLHRHVSTAEATVLWRPKPGSVCCPYRLSRSTDHPHPTARTGASTAEPTSLLRCFTHTHTHTHIPTIRRAMRARRQRTATLPLLLLPSTTASATCATGSSVERERGQEVSWLRPHGGGIPQTPGSARAHAHRTARQARVESGASQREREDAVARPTERERSRGASGEGEEVPQPGMARKQEGFSQAAVTARRTGWRARAAERGRGYRPSPSRSERGVGPTECWGERRRSSQRGHLRNQTQAAHAHARRGRGSTHRDTRN